MLSEEASYTYVKVKIDDLDTSNIETSIQQLPYFGGKYGNITIRSKYNREDSFIYTLVPKNNNNPVVERKIGHFEVLMTVEKAIEFEKVLKDFISSIKK